MIQVKMYYVQKQRGCGLLVNILLFIIGNKTDKINDKEIPTHIGQQFADRYEMDFRETSAKEADNVDKLFYTIAKKLTKEAKQGELTSNKDNVTFNDNTTSISNCSGCFKF